MKNEKIHAILAEISEAAIPSDSIDLGGKLRQRLETSESLIPKGETLMKPNIAKWPVVGRMALASAIAAFLLVLFLFTAPGQAFARSILHFFTRVTAPQFVMTPQSTTSQETESTFYDVCGEYENPTCTVAQLRSMVDFTVQAPAALPDGMRFAGGTGGPGIILLTYVNGSTGALLLHEQPWSEAEDQLWEVATSAIVESVTIGPIAGSGGYAEGEYAIGAWTGPFFRSWDPSPEMQTLRWRMGDTVYSLTSVGENKYQGRLLDKAGMASIAASLTDDPAVLAATAMIATPYPTPRFSFPTSIPFTGWIQTVEEAEALAGFKIITPTGLPDGYYFNYASYVPSKGNVCLFYRHPFDMNPDGSLVIIENASGRLPDVPEWTRLSLESLGFMDVDPEWINTPAIPVPVAGAVDGTAAEARTLQSSAIICGGNAQTFSRILLWRNSEGRSFIIMASGGPFNPYLSSIEARQLAENLNGYSTIPADTVDPERLASAEAAEAMLGMDILTPAFIPKPFVFEQAQYVVEDSFPTIFLAYSAGHVQFLSIMVRSGAKETLEDIFDQNPEYSQRLTVRNQSAAYLQGSQSVDTGEWCWTCSGAQILTWFENGMEYQIMIEYASGTTKETLIQIAESMK
ncbi:MAG: hypothetical protein WBM17_17265 [Anaerolineales bacterium]